MNNKCSSIILQELPIPPISSYRVASSTINIVATNIHRQIQFFYRGTYGALQPFEKPNANLLQLTVGQAALRLQQVVKLCLRLVKRGSQLAGDIAHCIECSVEREVHERLVVTTVGRA